MLDFINSNGVLFSGIFTIIGVLITAVITFFRENKKSRADTVKSLRKELENTKNELEKAQEKIADMQSVENAEKNIDKAHGSVYYEKLADGKSRAICGFCWEKERIKIPIVVYENYFEYSNEAYYGGFCSSCKNNCIDNTMTSVDKSKDNFDFDGELPF